MKRIINLIFIALLACSSLSAKRQMSDILVYNGKEYQVDNFHLEAYFKTNPDRKPDINYHATVLERGYVATFVVEDGKLFLTNLEIMGFDENKEMGWISVFREFFPTPRKVQCRWFTGTLWAGAFDEKESCPTGYADYCLFQVDKGYVVEEKTMKKGAFDKLKLQ